MSDGNGALPEGWDHSPLKALVTKDGIFDDGDWVESKDQDPNGAVRLIQLSDVGDGIFRDRSNRFLSVEKAGDLNCTFLTNGDVLISRLADPVGRACIFPEQSQQCVTVVDVCILRSGENGVDHLWLMNFINSPTFRAQIESETSGTTRKRISRKNLGGLGMRVPPLPEQRRIVSKIESLQERSSRARRALSEVGPLLEQFRQSVLRAAFSGRLTADWRAANPDVEPATELLNRIRTERRHRWEQSELAKYEAKAKQPPQNWQDKYKEPEPVDESELPELPDGWCWVSLGDLTLIDSGEAFKKKDYTESGIRLFQIANVSFGCTLWNQENFLPNSFGKSYPHLLLDDTDMTIALNRPIIDGRLKVTRLTAADLPAILYQRVGRMRTAVGSIADYLFAFMRGPSMLKQVESKLQGSDQPYINTSDIPRIVVPLAPFDEQAEIVRICNVAMDFVGEQSDEVAESESALTQLDQSILAKAFRGELVPQDPRDEPASELLARIRTTRETSDAAKATTKKKSKKKTPRPKPAKGKANGQEAT